VRPVHSGRYAALVAAVVALSASTVRGGEAPPARLLTGAWEWTGSHGGIAGLRVSPEREGSRKFLLLDSKGTYQSWALDPGPRSEIARGRYTWSPPNARCGGCAGYLRMRERPPGRGDTSFLVRFRGQDTLVLYPGAPGRSVTDGFEDVYRRLRRTAHPIR